MPNVMSAQERIVDGLRSTTRIMPLFQIIGHCLESLECGNALWRKRWSDLLAVCEGLLPRGNGFDVQPVFVRDSCKVDYIVISGSYHVMNQHGWYCGWRDYRVYVRPSFIHGLTLRVLQPGGGRDLGEFVGDSFRAHLIQPYDMNKLLVPIVTRDRDG